ncbi:MAG: fluoride efflux transporter CrcB [Parachlamydiaceae bacterium]
MLSILYISMGAAMGAVLRWRIGVYLNPMFSTIPLGTLAANLLGCFLMGAVVFFTTEHSFFSYQIRLALTTGFLGSLTTFSTFSAEALLLVSKGEMLWFWFLIGVHVFGSILMVFSGYLMAKVFFRLIGG